MGVNSTGNWADSEVGGQIQKRLTDESTLRSIDHLIERIGTLEKAVDQLNTLMAQGPGLMGILTDTLDETYQKAAQQGISIEQRANTGIKLLEKLTKPNTVAQIEQALDLAEQAPGLVGIMMDSIDEQMQSAQNKGVDLQALSQMGTTTAAALSQASKEAAKPIGGVFKLLKALKDPDRQKALGFLMNFLKVLGQKLS